MKITVLDASTLGSDISLDEFSKFGTVEIFGTTSADELPDRICDSDVLVLNKVRLTADILPHAEKLRLICVAATGYDNIDCDYCRAHGITLCNVPGYSTDSVAQITIALALTLACRFSEYLPYVTSGEYSASGIANKVEPPYHELAGKTWGIVGLGAIGKRVAAVAGAMGCRVIANKRTPTADFECVDMDTLCRESDIISIHTPLSDSTRNLISRERIALMKKNVIVVNVARGAVTDEAALADAVLEGKIGALGCDVFSCEPFPCDHPFYKIKSLPNVCLTPHMAWAAYESRARCISIMAKNIECFLNGAPQNKIV